MGKRLTTQEFIEKAKKIHGDKFDYSKVEYATCETNVCIICPIHGEFWQMPQVHLAGKVACPKCYAEMSSKRMRGNNWGRTLGVCGVGVNDYEGSVYDENGKLLNSFIHWYNFLKRCYDPKEHLRRGSYIGCSSCEEWKRFSNFKEWYDKHYVEGWYLDKDILVKGNKVYSPETCCFVPNEVNLLVVNAKRARGKYPIGVCKKGRRYASSVCRGKESRHLGYFDTPEEAFYAYKDAKEAYIKEVADKWKDQLEPRVYEAMYNYKVEITD